MKKRNETETCQSGNWARLLSGSRRSRRESSILSVSSAGRLVKREDGELQPRNPRFDSEIYLKITRAELGWFSVALPTRSPRVRLPLLSQNARVA